MSIPPPSSNHSPYNGPSATSQDDNLMAMLSYILGTFVTFLAPLVIWLVRKDQSKFVAFHAVQALLLHAFVAVGYIISGVLTAVLIGFLLFPLFFLFGLVFSILAGLAANKGIWYEIPIIAPYARQIAGV